MPSVTVRFHAGARDAARVAETQMRLEPGETIAALEARLIEQFPALERFRKSLLFAIREDYVSSNEQLSGGDVVSCFPPVSGG